jgi:hypothetical protein
MRNHSMLSTQIKTCQYETSCEYKTETCREDNMTNNIHAKPIIDNKFWIVEQGGKKCATLRKNEDNHFVLSNETGIKVYNNKESLTKQFGKDFFVAKIVKESNNSSSLEVHGFPSSCIPHNSMFDIRKKLPLFTKSNDSKSVYSAGYYVIRFDKGWVKSFCPKLITLQRYEFRGPFKTELEMKQVLSNVSK